MMDPTIPPSFSLPLPCSKIVFGTQVKIHLTLFLFFVVELAASLRFVTSYPLYSVLVIVLCGPLWIASVLVHELGHLWASRRLLGDEGGREIILWPLGGYTFCDGLSSGEESGVRGDLKDDIKIALAGPLTHIPMCLFWLAMYAAINHGDLSDFSFRNYLTVISSGSQGFFSTLFEQACLMNILLLWLNLFIPAYPSDGGRLMTASMLMVGVALNKAALLTFFASIVFSVALFAWSIASIVDGVGVTGILTLLIPFSIWAECYQLYLSIVGGRLREHPLFGRDCYIHRDARPSIFQLSNAARNASSTNIIEEDLEQSENVTTVPTETDIDQVTQLTDSE